MIIFDTLGVSETIFVQPRIRKTYPECRTNKYEYANDIKHSAQSAQGSAKICEIYQNIIKNTQNIKNHQKSSKNHQK